MLHRFKTFPCAAVEVKNEPILAFKEGSKERAELVKVNVAHTSPNLSAKSSNLVIIMHLKPKTYYIVLPGAKRAKRKDRGDSMCDRRRTDMDQRYQIPAVCECL